MTALKYNLLLLHRRQLFSLLLQQYHNTDTYLYSIGKGCASECAYQQYQQCGGGFTPEDEALFNSPALTDPVQSLDPTAAQQVFSSQQDGSVTPAPDKTGSSSITAWSICGNVNIALLTTAFAFVSTFFF